MTKEEFIIAYNIGHRDGKIDEYLPCDYPEFIEQEPCEDAVSPTAEPVGFEEAKKLIYQEWKSKVVKDNPNSRLLVAYQIAIKALEQEISGSTNKVVEQEPCDAVSRAAIDDIFERAIKSESANLAEDWKKIVWVKEHIKELPSVQPKQRTGHWIVYYDDLFPRESYMECSECGDREPLEISENFCPNCGAKMQEVKE